MYVREKLHWSLKDYNTYSAVTTTISFVGAFIGVSVIQRVFGISDVVFSIIAFVSSAAESIIKAFVITSWQIYFGEFFKIKGFLSKYSSSKVAITLNIFLNLSKMPSVKKSLLARLQNHLFLSK